MGLLELPWDIQQVIFSKLDSRDRAALRQVCQRLCDTMDDPTFWKSQIVRLSSIRRFREPMWNLLLHRNIRHIEVRPSPDETLESHRHNMVWNDLEWEQLIENLPGLKSITTPLKCDKNKGLPSGMQELEHLETLTAHSILYADHSLFRDVSRLSSLKQLCIEILCVDVLVERTEALRHLAMLRDLEDLELTFRRYVLLNKQAFQYLLYHLPKLRRLALRRCCFRFPDISVIFSQPPPELVTEAASAPAVPEAAFIYGQAPEEGKPADERAIESAEPARVIRLNLEELDLSGTLQHILNDEAIAALDTLQIFRLQTHGIDDDLADFFRKCLGRWKVLRELDVRNADLPAEIFRHVPASLRIVHLNLTYTSDDFSVEALLILADRCGSRLQGLHLHGATPKHMEKLYYLPDWFPRLTHLSIEGDIGKISREVLCRLGELDYLHELDVRECKVQPGKDVWEILASLLGTKTRVSF
ncbi:hypothetical protein BV898_01783 [Hypsibius exemplaris]|uniref:F-box domain-containing protein n=1 Tax=Hypsibius exemplaris TaxID=2072580 RepID=A0A1W0XAE3_HYPEX|nr:hypothetical protein BV898_01783 [Hypsibius exemplaris]